MQKHEGSRELRNDNRPKRTTTWWLMLVIVGLLGLIAGNLVQRWLWFRIRLYSLEDLMPRERSTKAAENIVDIARTTLPLDLVVELAEPLARYMLGSYADQEWRDSPQVEALARAAAVLEANDRKVPAPILEALRRAAETGRIGLA
jgi:hypothetical protein